MSSKVNNLGIPSIDSCKIRLQLRHLKGYDVSLLDDIEQWSKQSGECEKEFKRNKKDYFCNEYTFGASIQSNVRIGASEHDLHDCITLIVNSKQLKENYFIGLTLNTFPSIYEQIKELGILDCSYKTFIEQSVMFDIDVKVDYQLSLDSYKELLKTCKIMTKQSSNRDKGVTMFSSDKNLGCAWSTRGTSKYLSNPYLKIYHKGIELTYHSDAFYNEYLNAIDVKDTFRIEATVKNRSHLRKLDLGLKEFTTKEILSLTHEQLRSIITQSINAHLSARSKGLSFKTKATMSPSERTILNSILGFTTELNWSIIRTENYLLNGINDKTAKYRKKKLINELYNDHIKGTNYAEKSKEIEAVFDQLGWH